jgi:hypothetical protein
VAGGDTNLAELLDNKISASKKGLINKNTKAYSIDIRKTRLKKGNRR